MGRNGQPAQPTFFCSSWHQQTFTKIPPASSEPGSTTSYFEQRKPARRMESRNELETPLANVFRFIAGPPLVRTFKELRFLRKL
ncbi:hypothetical protein CEXT_245361 [Caerostris extrusa]|uniref:Uncharacterized protein n=1 Tax=Caerostris extrusa TaxID=172846 RepID=A0AAV4YCG1_CAEEX|nr:hypothetical protein CEXT_245361 [Caerostris extrusa]